MRKLMVKLSLVVAILLGSIGLAGTAVHADSGNPYTPGDGRWNPLTGDRIAVYCNSTYIDVLGVDNDSVGFRLAMYQASDLTAAQTKAQTQTVPGFGTLTLVSDGAGSYHVAWTGGSFGATGSDAFVKYFTCGL